MKDIPIAEHVEERLQRKIWRTYVRLLQDEKTMQAIRYWREMTGWSLHSTKYFTDEILAKLGQISIMPEGLRPVSRDFPISEYPEHYNIPEILRHWDDKEDDYQIVLRRHAAEENKKHQNLVDDTFDGVADNV